MNSSGRTFADAVLLARQLTRSPEIFELRADYAHECSSHMDETTERVLDALRPSFLENPFKVVSIDKVRQIVVSAAGLREIRVCVVESPIGFRNIYGYVEREENAASIVCDAGLNFCWRRFTVLKELMHIYSDTVKDFEDDWLDGTHYARLLIQNAVDSRAVEVKKPDQSLDSEAFAFYMALEVILPWALRNQLALLKKLSASNYQIAKAFLMPKRFVDLFMDEDESYLSYMRLSANVNSEIEL